MDRHSIVTRLLDVEYNCRKALEAVQCKETTDIAGAKNYVRTAAIALFDAALALCDVERMERGE